MLVGIEYRCSDSCLLYSSPFTTFFSSHFSSFVQLYCLTCNYFYYDIPIIHLSHPPYYDIKTSTHKDIALLPYYSSIFKELSHLLAQLSFMFLGLIIVSLLDQELWKIKLGENSLRYWLLLFICSFCSCYEDESNFFFFFCLFISILFQRIVFHEPHEIAAIQPLWTSSTGSC